MVVQDSEKGSEMEFEILAEIELRVEVAEAK
jgi:hypothetical protein